MASSERTQSDVDRIAEGWVDTLVELNPAVGTYIGRPSADDRLADYSPDGHERSIEAIRSTLRALRAAEPADDIDRITVADLGSELALELEGDEARLHLRDLNVIASPAQEIREVFDLMPTDSRDDWERIATRLGDVPRAIDGYIATLRAGAAEGVVPAVRQVREVAAQAHRIAKPDGFFATFAEQAKAGDEQLAEPLRGELERAAAGAASAYGTLAAFLEGELQRSRASATGSAETSTRCGRATSSAPSSTSMRPTSGASRNAIASATDAPGRISRAMDSCSATMRASSSMPHS